MWFERPRSNVLAPGSDNLILKARILQNKVNFLKFFGAQLSDAQLISTPREDVPPASPLYLRPWTDRGKIAPLAKWTTDSAGRIFF